MASRQTSSSPWLPACSSPSSRLSAGMLAAGPRPSAWLTSGRDNRSRAPPGLASRATRPDCRRSPGPSTTRPAAGRPPGRGLTGPGHLTHAPLGRAWAGEDGDGLRGPADRDHRRRRRYRAGDRAAAAGRRRAAAADRPGRRGARRAGRRARGGRAGHGRGLGARDARGLRRGARRRGGAGLRAGPPRRDLPARRARGRAAAAVGPDDRREPHQRLRHGGRGRAAARSGRRSAGWCSRARSRSGAARSTTSPTAPPRAASSGWCARSRAAWRRACWSTAWRPGSS